MDEAMEKYARRMCTPTRITHSLQVHSANAVSTITILDPCARTINQVVQAEGTTTPSSPASLMHSRFCAAAVRKSAEELAELWS